MKPAKVLNISNAETEFLFLADADPQFLKADGAVRFIATT
jgi:hypothetical protein